MGRAVELARMHDATVYDATFASLAESLGATFVTADERLVRRLEPPGMLRHLGQVANA